jgi:RNA 3'-terminal phosphate cyclase
MLVRGGQLVQMTVISKKSAVFCNFTARAKERDVSLIKEASNRQSRNAQRQAHAAAQRSLPSDPPMERLRKT